MRVERVGNWLLYEDRFDKLRANWRAAPLHRRIVLTDGRPAVLSSDNTLASTIPMPVWQEVKRKLRRTEDFHLLPQEARTRHCEMCTTPLKVTREYSHAWTFKCPSCKSVEVHGKSQVGGTIGAGEVEKE